MLLLLYKLLMCVNRGFKSILTCWANDSIFQYHINIISVLSLCRRQCRSRCSPPDRNHKTGNGYADLSLIIDPTLSLTSLRTPSISKLYPTAQCDISFIKAHRHTVLPQISSAPDISDGLQVLGGGEMRCLNILPYSVSAEASPSLSAHAWLCDGDRSNGLGIKFFSSRCGLM